MVRLLTFIAAALWMIASLSPVHAQDEAYLSCADFIAKVDAGAVKSVALDPHSRIAGVYLAAGDKQEVSFCTYDDTEAAKDVLLLRLLRERGVPVSLQDKAPDSGLAGYSLFFGLLFLLLPLLTLALLFRIHSKLNQLQRLPATSTGGDTDILAPLTL